MNQLPQEILQGIGARLTILEVKRWCISNKLLSQSLFNYNFWKNFIRTNFADYYVRNENMILEQIKYLHKITINKEPTIYTIKNREYYKNNNSELSEYNLQREYYKNKNGELSEYNLQRLTKKAKCLKMKHGDILKIEGNRGNEFCFFESKIVQIELFMWTDYWRIAIIPDSMNIINELPLTYYFNKIHALSTWKFSPNEFITKFNTTPYMDQIKNNLSLVQGSNTVLFKQWHTKFRHIYGKEYFIDVYIFRGACRLNMPKDKIYSKEFAIELISKGYFAFSNKEKHDNLIIDTRAITYVDQLARYNNM